MPERIRTTYDLPFEAITPYEFGLIIARAKALERLSKQSDGTRRLSVELASFVELRLILERDDPVALSDLIEDNNKLVDHFEAGFEDYLAWKLEERRERSVEPRPRPPEVQQIDN